MPDLIAQGSESTDRWRKALPTDVPTVKPVPLGRTAEIYEVPWDNQISRVHAMMIWDGRLLHVSRRIDARNPIYFRGQRDDEFSLPIGEHFVIGSTSFTLASQQIEVASDSSNQPLVSEQSFTAKELDSIRYRDAQRRIDALARLSGVIGGSTNDDELVVRVINILMTAIRHATFIAIVRDPGASTLSAKSQAKELVPEVAAEAIQILHWDSRDLNRRAFAPSRSLIHRAIALGQSVLHTWTGQLSFPNSAIADLDQSPAHTEMANVDWSFCVPIAGTANEGWAIYVAGTLEQLSDSNDPFQETPELSNTLILQEEMKFTELTASTIAAVRQARYLQQRHDLLRPFFAPVVRKAIMRKGSDQELQPREANVAVLFCDLRGFSQTSEQLEDRLFELLHRVSDALGVTTKHILLRDGVVGDFHGDAAMGFWGWPIQTDDYVQRAVEAALAIHSEFQMAAGQAGHALSGFHAGLGIASGRAVAGQIGTVDQVKITVFGPVVNLAARLESMTKQLLTPILIDEATAQAIREANISDVARTRRVAKILPAGLKKPVMVSELLPGASVPGSISDAAIVAYERALDAFQAGKWGEAFELLHAVPANDRVKDFLTVFIAQHGRRPPTDWPGFVILNNK